ncbi:unnamed protein product [Leuciscus chuanchicus]
MRGRNCEVAGSMQLLAIPPRPPPTPSPVPSRPSPPTPATISPNCMHDIPAGLVNNPSYGFLTLFSVLLALPFSKRKLVDPRVTSAPQRSASTEFPDVRVQSHCSGSQVSCISVWRQATALLSIHTYHPDPSTYLLFSLQARYQSENQQNQRKTAVR